MKIKCLFICFVLCSFLSTAQNNLIILDENGQKFYLFIENKQINDSAQTEVKAVKLYDDTFSIKAVFSNKNIPAFIGKVFLLENGKTTSKKEFTYSIATQKNKTKLNFISINDIQSDTGVKAVLPEIRIKSIMIAEELRKTESNRINERYPPAQPCKKAMSDSLLHVNLKTLKDNHIDLSRMKDAKWFISNNCINTAQLKQIMLLFDYKSSQVKIAEFAFDYIEDHRNFLEVVEAVEAGIEKNELKKFYDKRIEK